MSKTWEIELPDDVSAELERLPESRVNQVVSEAVREALDLQQSAEARRDELKERMGIGSRDSEELTEGNLTDAEAKQEQLHRKRREGR